MHQVNWSFSLKRLWTHPNSTGLLKEWFSAYVGQQGFFWEFIVLTSIRSHSHLLMTCLYHEFGL